MFYFKFRASLSLGKKNERSATEGEPDSKASICYLQAFVAQATCGKTGGNSYEVANRVHRFCFDVGR